MLGAVARAAVAVSGAGASFWGWCAGRRASRRVGGDADDNSNNKNSSTRATSTGTQRWWVACCYLLLSLLLLTVGFFALLLLVLLLRLRFLFSKFVEPSSVSPCLHCSTPKNEKKKIYINVHNRLEPAAFGPVSPTILLLFSRPVI